MLLKKVKIVLYAILILSEAHADGKHEPRSKDLKSAQTAHTMLIKDNPFINNAETISAAQFEQALAQEPGDLAALDATSKAYLLSKTIPRADKLTFMWQQLKKIP